MNKLLSIVSILTLLLAACTQNDKNYARNSPTEEINNETIDKEYSQPINISDIKKLDFLMTTSGVLPISKAKFLCNNEKDGFYGFYSLIHKDKKQLMGLLTVYTTDIAGNWGYDSTNETFSSIELTTSDIKVWDSINVGISKSELLNFIGTNIYAKEDETIHIDLGEYFSSFAISNDTISSIKIIKLCSSNVTFEQASKSTLIEQQILDFDKNGVMDTFSLYKPQDDEMVEINLNGDLFTFNAVSTYFDSIANPNIQRMNQLSSQYFVFFETINKRPLLYMKDKGDFAGNVNLILGLNNNKIDILLNEQYVPISIQDDSMESTYLIVKEITTEPGSQGEYNFVNYPLFKVFNLSTNPMTYDSIQSIRYNLTHNEGFEEYLKMEYPVLGLKYGSSGDFKLLDLDTIKR